LEYEEMLVKIMKPATYAEQDMRIFAQKERPHMILILEATPHHFKQKEAFSINLMKVSQDKQRHYSVQE